MSPKSTMPVIRPASSVRALSVVRSPWTTCARSDGQAGATTSSYRSRTRSTRARCRGSRMAPISVRVRDACWTSQSIVRCGRRVEEATKGAAEPRGGLAPAAERGVGQLARVDPTAPGQHVVQAHVVGAVGAVDGGAPGRCGVAGRARDHPRQGERQLRVDPRRVEDGEGLHVERGRDPRPRWTPWPPPTTRPSASSRRNVRSRSLPEIARGGRRQPEGRLRRCRAARARRDRAVMPRGRRRSRSGRSSWGRRLGRPSSADGSPTVGG